ncbi:MAG: polygalacturonase, partial [Prevotella sp.]
MKNIKHILFLLVIALTGLSLTGCNSEDNLDTDQYGNDISVLSFGPCPVLRGGTLHFLGSNLDQISEIDLPGADPITQYEVVKAGRESEITIQVPAEKCDTGIVVLKTQKGGEIRTLTPITYREDIVVKDFYVGSDTSSKTGSVGDILTIEGDYLNLFHGIIFAENDTVTEDQFTEHTRYSIKVAIPKEAKTGNFKLTNLAETPTEYESKEVLTVNLPEATGIDNTKPKAGQTITISGTSLDQIVSVKFKGATVTDVTPAADGKSLSVVVPATATDGEVTLITASGVEIPAESITTVVPTDLSYAPAPVKNGATITVSGKDLDLITKFLFPNGDKGIEVDAVYKDGKISATVPAGAQPGNLTLELANGKTVSLEYKLVEPAVTKFTPAAV